jgi:cytochrome c553
MIRVLCSSPLIVALAASACSGPGEVRDAFNRDGEVIALSGGSAGAANACVSCHGLAGEGDGDRSPRLAGLDQGYLARQLGFYAEGQRIDPRMVAVAKVLTGDERQKVAAYYARLPARRSCPTAPAPVSLLYAEGDAARGIASCASCHGARGEGNAGNPPLAGQPAPYLEQQVRAWRVGDRYGDPLGAMTRIAKALTPAEAAALTAYAARLPGDARYSAPPEGCPPARRASPRSGA